MPNDIIEAVNLIVETARREFAEPQGNPALYRFSVNDGALEIMHAARRPIEWRIVPLNTPTKIKADAE